MGSASSHNPFQSVAQPVNVQDCPEEFDQTKREAMFAFRTTDLGSNDQSSAVIKELKHWSLVVHFPRGDKTYLTLHTCPRELLELAKQVKSNGTEYNLTTNNCQTWLKEFLQLISPKLFKSFQAM